MRFRRFSSSGERKRIKFDAFWTLRKPTRIKFDAFFVVFRRRAKRNASNLMRFRSFSYQIWCVFVVYRVRANQKLFVFFVTSLFFVIAQKLINFDAFSSFFVSHLMRFRRFSYHIWCVFVVFRIKFDTFSSLFVSNLMRFRRFSSSGETTRVKLDAFSYQIWCIFVVIRRRAN